MLLWLLVAVGPPLLGRCGGVTDPGSNRTTAEGAEASAAADGSVKLAIPASPQDEYELTASTGDGSQTVPLGAPTSSDGADAGDSPDACSALRETLGARVAAGFAAVDKTCQRDEDCVFFAPDVGCYSRCPNTIASRAGSQAAAAAVLPAIAALCDQYDRQHCETGPLTCNSGSPVLVCNGTCTALDSLGCDELSARAAVRVSTLVDDVSRSCSQDSDCALAQVALRCLPSCGNIQSVAASALADLERSIAQTQALYCGQSESRGCPGPVALPCAPPLGTPRATCNAARCELTYAASP